MTKPIRTEDIVDEFGKLVNRVNDLERALRRIQGVQGEVAADGTVVVGDHFSVVQNGVGDYTITYDAPFDQIPVVVVSAGRTAGDLAAKVSSLAPPSTTAVRVSTFDTTSGVSTDASFSFQATQS